jgi:hypothetical protein
MINVDGTYIHICLVFVLRVLEVRGKRDRKLKTCMYGDGICHQQLSIAARLRVEAFSCQRWCICDSCPCCHPRLLTFFQRGCQRQQTTALLEGIRDHDGMIISFLSSIYDQLAWIYRTLRILQLLTQASRSLRHRYTSNSNRYERVHLLMLLPFAAQRVPEKQTQMQTHTQTHSPFARSHIRSSHLFNKQIKTLSSVPNAKTKSTAAATAKRPTGNSTRSSAAPVLPNLHHHHPRLLNQLSPKTCLQLLRSHSTNFTLELGCTTAAKTTSLNFSSIHFVFAVLMTTPSMVNSPTTPFKPARKTVNQLSKPPSVSSRKPILGFYLLGGLQTRLKNVSLMA